MGASATQKIILLLESRTGATSGRTTTDYHDVARMQDFVAELVATEDVNGTTFDAKIEHSADGTTWHDWIVFTQLASASGKEVKAPTVPPLGLLRVTSANSGGTWSFTVKLSANHLS